MSVSVRQSAVDTDARAVRVLDPPDNPFGQVFVVQVDPPNRSLGDPATVTQFDDIPRLTSWRVPSAIGTPKLRRSPGRGPAVSGLHGFARRRSLRRTEYSTQDRRTVSGSMVDWTTTWNSAASPTEGLFSGSISTVIGTDRSQRVAPAGSGALPTGIDCPRTE